MKEARAESKIQVRVLDLSGLEQQAHNAMQKKDYRKDLECIKATETLGYVETPKGLYMLCQEGVGDRNPISKKNPAEVVFVREFSKEDGAKTLEMFPCFGYRLSADEVRALPVKEVVTLDKFIRSFGSRLENNYRLWQEHLSKELRDLQTVVA